ncbi:Site-specific recombinase [Candidatus Terasakiella magnetica]|nr:Site-specific recombinase [Candidatus Terasakiella magnetica]
MIVGYFRQIDGDETSPTTVLRAARCLRIESERPGSREARNRLVADLTNGDVLVSPSISHLAASVTDLVALARRIHGKGATLRVVAEQVDTLIPAARNVFAALAESERRTLAARRDSGLREASLRGASPGRPRKLDAKSAYAIRDEIASGRTYASIAREMGVHPTTVMRMISRLTEL